MSLFAKLLGGPIEQKAAGDFAALTWQALLGSPASKTGVSVNVDSSLKASAAFACTKVIAEDVAKVPFKLFRESGRTKEIAKGHPAHFLFGRRPNDWMTPQAFRETLQVHACLSHGGTAYVSRNSNGDVLELIPLLPQDVRPTQDPQTSEVVFDVALRSGERKRLARSAVFYLPGLSWNGYSGLETVRVGAEAIGLHIAIEEGQARLHANGGRPGGILTTDQKLDPKQVLQIKERWDTAHGGVGRWGGTALLDGNLKFQQMALSGVDAQTLESRKHQVEEVARFFRVHPSKIGYSDKATTYASAEQFAIAHVVDTMMPWGVRWEQAAGLYLLTDDEWREGYFFKTMLQGLLRGDAAARGALYKAAINDGWMTRNEVRALEELDALDGLDVPLRPLNMADGSKPMDAAPGAPQNPPAPQDGSMPLPADGPVVQDTALNGAQVASLLAIVDQVATGQLPPSTARALILASFPAVPTSTIDAMLSGLDGFTPDATVPGGTPAPAKTPPAA